MCISAPPCVCVGGVAAVELDCEIKQVWFGDHAASQRRNGGSGRVKMSRRWVNEGGLRVRGWCCAR